MRSMHAGIRRRKGNSAFNDREQRGQSIVMVAMLIPVMLGII